MSVVVGDCVLVMQSLEDDCVDLTVTSPPYDGLRSYNGYSFDFEKVARELYRVTKPGGVVVWVVGDATVNGSETGTSFRQALFFKECGFNLHDTMIYQKAGTGACGSNLSYWQSFEYMFVFSKGTPKSINRLRQANSSVGAVAHTGRISKDGIKKDNKIRTTPETAVRPNVWRYTMEPRFIFNDDKTIKHPARFPDALAMDHILSWSNEGDLVFDPFLGSGTTGKVAVANRRLFFGCDISEEYAELARSRIGQST